jgi:hypothetical protein
MAGEQVHELIKAHQAAPPECSYMSAYQAVVHADPDEADPAILAYKSGDARYVEADQIRSLAEQVRGVAGRTLDAMAKAERKKSGSDYRNAFVEVAQTNPEIAKDYGFRPPEVPLKDTRRWSW